MLVLGRVKNLLLDATSMRFFEEELLDVFQILHVGLSNPLVRC